MKRRILTRSNEVILYDRLKEYLLWVLADEEYFNTLHDLYIGAEQAKGNNDVMSPHIISSWLRGLPIGIEYVTYNICCKFFQWLNLPEEDVGALGEDGSKYEESQTDLDNFYYKTLGKIVYFGGRA